MSVRGGPPGRISVRGGPLGRISVRGGFPNSNLRNLSNPSNLTNLSNLTLAPPWVLFLFVGGLWEPRVKELGRGNPRPPLSTEYVWKVALKSYMIVTLTLCHLLTMTAGNPTDPEIIAKGRGVDQI